MSYIRSKENHDATKAMNPASDQLRWAMKCYSRILRHPVWVVLKYPYDNRVEVTYLRMKKELGLTKKTRGTKWQIWPDGFTATDGSPLYEATK